MSGDTIAACKALIVDALKLEGVAAADIGDEDPLFDGGLGLDSIDALELAIAIEKRFGVRIRAEEAHERKIFRHVAALADYIDERRAEGQPA